MYAQFIDAILPLNAQYGANLATAVLAMLSAAWLLAPAPMLANWQAWLGRHMGRVTLLLLIATLALALSYLPYPSYLDHVEATCAMLGRVLREGGNLWPDLRTDFSYRGLLYGPGLSEIQWIATFMPLDPILASKVPGVLAFVMSVCLVYPQLRNVEARVYLLLALPFGMLLFWARAEPIFLVLVAATLHSNNKKCPPLVQAIFVGALFGVATSLKMHAGIYVAAAYFCVPHQRKFATLAAMGATACAVFIISFTPPQASLDSFLAYLKLAAHHGLGLKMAIKNVREMAIMLLPIGLALMASPASRPWFWPAAVFAGSASIVALIGAKPGAGPHHLIPLILVGASLLDQLITANPSNNKVRRAAYLVGLSHVLPTIVMLLVLSFKMVATWAGMADARAEIDAIGKKYPSSVMGLSGWMGYHYTFLRVALPASSLTQTDFASYMDLQFSGVSDEQYQLALGRCMAPYIVMPKIDSPFSLASNYNSTPLMSPETRTVFMSRYQVEDVGTHYNVWHCNGS
jgi:hypothetical protein